ncbi:MAG TPA: hypothetical protein VGI11_03175 [Variovorax sp.]|jgi:hypothetical protein
MRTTSQKAEILARAGIAVPAFPAEGESAAAERWKREIDNLFAGYVAARAARSLREAEEALQLDRLRRANCSPHLR